MFSPKYAKILLKWTNFYLSYSYIWDILCINFCLSEVIFYLLYYANFLILTIVLLYYANCLNTGEENLPICFVELFGCYHIKLPRRRCWIDPTFIFFSPSPQVPSKMFLTGHTCHVCSVGLIAGAVTFYLKIIIFFLLQCLLVVDFFFFLESLILCGNVNFRKVLPEFL